MKTNKRQKNYSVSAQLLDAFEAHCARNLLDERIIIETVMLRAMEADHKELVAMRQRLEAWFSEQEAAAESAASHCEGCGPSVTPQRGRTRTRRSPMA